ncbi:hypothetical protein [Burkholderia anthina]|uniref:hypothetical protein n=1 Tax=Burkholderia anthina TaxID=179879 RepID=UPI000ADDFBF1|nr:hypothetical protein [Burkholderia anthina]
MTDPVAAPVSSAGHEGDGIGYRVSRHGWHFAQLPQAGHEFTLMLLVFAMQVAAF